MCVEYYEGYLMEETRFRRGFVAVENGIIQEVNYHSSPPKEPIISGIIVPSFVNAHTHVADRIFRKKFQSLNNKSIEKIFKYPNGLKHLWLSEMDNEEKIKSMKLAIEEMMSFGCSYFCDFREEGREGAENLIKVMKEIKMDGKVLGRVQQSEYDKKEVYAVLKIADGIGISALSDGEYHVLKKISDAVKRERKVLAMHAFEDKIENVEHIIELRPDFLIHMTWGDDADFQALSESNIPVVVCPTSNMMFGMRTPIKKMIASNLTVGIGTDNLMVAIPNILNELKVILSMGLRDEEKLLEIGWINPRKILNLSHDVLFNVGAKASFVVLRCRTTIPQEMNLKRLVASADKIYALKTTIWRNVHERDAY